MTDTIGKPAKSLLRYGMALLPQALRLGAPALAQILLARALSPALFGAFSIATIWAGFGALLAIGGMQFTIVKVLPREHPANHRQLYGFVLRRALRNAALVCVPAAIAAFALPADWLPLARSATLACVLLVPAIALATLRPAATMALGRPWAAQLPENILRPLAFAVTVGVLASYGIGLITTLTLLLASYALAAAIGHGVLSRLVRAGGGVPPSPVTTRAELLHSARHNALATLATSFTRIGDVIIVGLLVPVEQFAIYVVVSRILDLFNAFYLVADPSFEADWSRLIATGNRAGLLLSLRHYLAIQLAWAIAASLVLLLFASPILGLFGSYYQTGSTLMWIVPLAILAKALAGPSAQLLILGDRERINFVTSLASTAAYLLLVAMLTAARGIEGALLAMVAYQVLRGSIQAVATRRALAIDPTALTLLRKR